MDDAIERILEITRAQWFGQAPRATNLLVWEFDEDDDWIGAAGVDRGGLVRGCLENERHA